MAVLPLVSAFWDENTLFRHGEMQERGIDLEDHVLAVSFSLERSIDLERTRPRDLGMMD